MSEKVLVMLAEGFEDIEAVTVIDILHRAGLTVRVAGLSSTEPVRASNGTVVVPDAVLPESIDDYQGCVLPGGQSGAENLAASESVKRIILRMHEQGKLIAAICASPAVVLAPLGILKGKKATCYPSFRELLSDDVAYSEDPVVRDGNILTSRGPATALLFALVIVEQLKDAQTARKIWRATLAEDVFRVPPMAE